MTVLSELESPMRIPSLSLAIAVALAFATPVADAFAIEPPEPEAPTAPQVDGDADEAGTEDGAPGDASQDMPATEPDAREQARAIAASDDPDAVSGAYTRVPLEEIRRYVAVFNAIREGYVDPVEDRKLMDSAIRGLLLDLDPHSAYLGKADAAEFEEDATGAYDGIGVEVMQLPDGRIRIVSPIDGTPAEKAGIRAGDTVIAVDGRELTPADNEGHGPLRGPPGSQTVLTVVREGEAEPLEITVRRETIRVASVRSRMLEPGYGYFQVDTATEFEKTLAHLHEEAGGRLKGLVIDLRSNPGGLLAAAVQVADDLLDAGGIVSTRGRAAVNDTEFKATAGDLMQGAPIVVIVDAGSASASEVLAAALRDNGRARIIGSRTFGKGSVQTVLPLGNGDSVKLTTARYYTPKGRSIQARGIDPDVVLQPQEGGARRVIAEAVLPGHLRGEDGDDAEAGPGDVLPGDGPIDAALVELRKSAATTASVAAPQPDRH
jgi:carboxyl-terminal processing protease